MSQTIRWLHLSGIHVGKDNYSTRKMFDYILEHARAKKAAGVLPDLLFITGDLANSGLASEYVTFWTEFAWPLQEVIGEGSGERTFTVPGNHDVDRLQHPAFSREEMCDAKRQYFDPTSEGKRLRKMLMPRFKAFQEEDSTVEKGAFSGERGAFFRVVEIAGVNVGIAGINTAWLSKDDHDERKLTPGKMLLEQALDQLQQSELRIVLGHHPLDWIIPGEQKAIKSLLGKHSVLYLHGHLHEAWVEPTYGSGHQFLAIQSGAGFQRRRARSGAMGWFGVRRTWMHKLFVCNLGNGILPTNLGRLSPMPSPSRVAAVSGGSTRYPGRRPRTMCKDQLRQLPPCRHLRARTWRRRTN